MRQQEGIHARLLIVAVASALDLSSAIAASCLPSADPRVPHVRCTKLCKKSSAYAGCKRLCQGVHRLLAASCDDLTSTAFLEDTIQRVGLVNDGRAHLYGEEGEFVIPLAEAGASRWSMGLYQSPSQLAAALQLLSQTLSPSPMRFLELGVFSGWTTSVVAAFLSRFGDGASTAAGGSHALPKVIAADVHDATNVPKWNWVLWKALNVTYLDNTEDMDKFHDAISGYNRYPARGCADFQALKGRQPQSPKSFSHSAAACAARCDSSPACSCAVYQHAEKAGGQGGRCIGVKSCVPAECPHDPKSSTFVKASRDGAALSSPLADRLHQLTLSHRTIDVCLIDGDHSYWAVRRDYAQVKLASTTSRPVRSCFFPSPSVLFHRLLLLSLPSPAARLVQDRHVPRCA